MQIKPKCDMLIDQNKYIGSDPVGHCCFNEAVYQDSEYFACAECLEHIKAGDGKITIPQHGSVKYFSTMCNSIIERLKGAK